MVMTDIIAKTRNPCTHPYIQLKKSEIFHIHNRSM